MQQLALNKAMTELDGLHVRVDLMRKELIKKLVYLQPGNNPSFYNIVLASKSDTVEQFKKLNNSDVRKLLQNELESNNASGILYALDWLNKLYFQLINGEAPADISQRQFAAYNPLLTQIMALKEQVLKWLSSYTVESIAMCIHKTFEYDWPEGEFSNLISIKYSTYLKSKLLYNQARQIKSLKKSNDRLIKQSKSKNGKGNLTIPKKPGKGPKRG